MRVRFTSLGFVIATLTGCTPSHVLIEVQDPDGLATGADTISVGRDATETLELDISGQDFPLNFSVSGFEPGEVVLFWVDAKRGDDILARGRTRAEFPDDPPGSASVVLAPPCDNDGDEDPEVGCALPDSPGQTGVCIEGRCGESLCGDSVVDPATEACDDGNEDVGDACPDGPTGSCAPAFCGDGYLQRGVEPCDDGDTDNDDRCRTSPDGNCVINVCGDGFVNRDTNPSTGAPFEECDDGNTIDEDACRVVRVGDELRCLANVCGDRIVNRIDSDGDDLPDEECDDGNDNPNDGCDACRLVDWNVTVRFGAGDNIGRPTLNDNRIETLSLQFVTGLATAENGDLLIADAVSRRVWQYDRTSDRVFALAGIGQSFLADNLDTPAERRYGDGGPALRAALTPYGLAVDEQNRLYIADRLNFTNTSDNPVRFNAIRRVDLATGRITSFAGGPRFGFDGDGGEASAATLAEPTDVAVAPDGTVYIADSLNYRLRVVRNGIIQTVAGSGGCGPIAATTFADPLSAPLCVIRGVAVDGTDVYLSTSRPDERELELLGSPPPPPEASGDQVWRLRGGELLLVAGTGNTAPEGGEVFDGGPAVDAELFTPWGLVFDAGTLYIADADHHRVRAVDSSGMITTVAGTGFRGRALGDNATTSQVDRPIQVSIFGGALLIGEVDERVIEVDLATDALSPLTGAPTNEAISGFPPQAFPLDRPRGVAFAGNGDLYIADQDAGRIYRVPARDAEFPPSGNIEVVAGSGGFSVFTHGFSGDGAAATAAQLNQPHDVAVDSDGNLFIADTLNHVVRRVSAMDGFISTIAGVGGNPDSAFTVGVGRVDLRANEQPKPAVVNGDFAGDTGLATAARLNLPSDVEVAPNGDVYIADYLNLRIRRVRGGVIETVAGDGSLDWVGPDGPAIGYVGDMAIADGGALYFAAYTRPRRHSIWRLDPGDDSIREIVEIPSFRDDLPPEDDRLNRLEGLAVIEQGGGAELLVAFGDPRQEFDEIDDYVYSITVSAVDGEPVPSEPVIVAGNATSQVVGDRGAAVNSRFRSLGKLAVDPFGNWVSPDRILRRVRGVDVSTGIVDTVVGWVSPGDGIGSRVRLGAPRIIFYEPSDEDWLVIDDLGQPEGIPNASTIRRVDLQQNSVTTVIGRLFGRNANFVTTSAEELQGFAGIGGFATTSDGTWYLTSIGRHSVFRITRPLLDNPETWTAERFAGLPLSESGAGSENGAALDARFRNPGGLALDEEANRLYMADTGNHTIRVIDLVAGTVGPVAGTPEVAGFGGDGVPGGLADALFNRPSAVVIACDGSLYVSDTENHRVRRIDLTTSTIETVVGTGAAESAGDSIGSRSPVNAPIGLAFDRFGNMLVTSTDTLRMVTAGDDATCAGGIGLPRGEDAVYTVYGALPRTEYPESVTRCIEGIAADPTRDDRFLMADACQGIFVELTR
ncbi:MAG: DUF4215 domain-containing protein [Myxococcota bacterium]